MSLIEWMTTTPLILAPVGAGPAFTHETRRVEIGSASVSVFRAFGYAQTFNVYGFPSVCVPAGRAEDGMPIGVQIVGRPFAENAVLSAARSSRKLSALASSPRSLIHSARTIGYIHIKVEIRFTFISATRPSGLLSEPPVTRESRFAFPKVPTPLRAKARIFP